MRMPLEDEIEGEEAREAATAGMGEGEVEFEPVSGDKVRMAEGGRFALSLV